MDDAADTGLVGDDDLEHSVDGLIGVLTDICWAGGSEDMVDEYGTATRLSSSDLRQYGGETGALAIRRFRTLSDRDMLELSEGRKLFWGFTSSFDLSWHQSGNDDADGICYACGSAVVSLLLPVSSFVCSLQRCQGCAKWNRATS